MLTLPPSVRVFVCLTPADMRRSLDGLAAMTREILKEDPLSGHLFVFFNRRRDRTKILLWDRSGLCLYYKRIEKGVFRLSSLERPEPRSRGDRGVRPRVDSRRNRTGSCQASQAFRPSQDSMIASRRCRILARHVPVVLRVTRPVRSRARDT